jgi:hypothetical protein
MENGVLLSRAPRGLEGLMVGQQHFLDGFDLRPDGWSRREGFGMLDLSFLAGQMPATFDHDCVQGRLHGPSHFAV